MSSLQSPQEPDNRHGHHTKSTASSSSPERPGAPHSNGNAEIVDQNILRRVADLSLSRPPRESSSDAEADSSQAATDFVSNLASSPLSPTAESATSFDFERSSLSDRQSSPSPQPSLYSLTESVKEQATRLEYGRVVNTHSDVYKFAADEREAERLDKQHELFKIIFGDYAPPFRGVLNDDGDPLRQKACLDVGCGSGAWILEVASAFPHVSCTAVDLVPLPAIIPSLIERTVIPPNLRFEIDDVALGLEHFAGDFDAVHVRHISSGVKDYYRLIDDVALALRPRGLADFTENDWRVYDIEKFPLIASANDIWGSVEPPEGWTGRGMARSGTSPTHRPTKADPSKSTPYFARIITLLRQAALRRGAHVDAAALLQRWVSEHPAYEDVTYREFWLPVGEWMDNIDIRNYPDLCAMSKEELERLRWIGKETGEDLMEALLSMQPLLLSSGVPETLVHSLTEKAHQEIRAGRTPLYIRAQNVYARKKERRQEVASLLLS